MRTILDILSDLLYKPNVPAKEGVAVPMPSEPQAVADGGSLLLSEDDMASLLGVSSGAVRRLNAGGKIPEPVRLGNFLRWRRTEIESWVDRGCLARESWTWTTEAGR